MIKIEENVDTYWIITNLDQTIIHYGVVKVGNIVVSGLEKFELYTDNSSWENRLLDLGIDTSYYNDDTDGAYES